MSFQLDFVEGPPGNPVDLTNVVAVIGFCSALTPTVPPYNSGNLPQVKSIQAPASVSVGGYGPAPELAHLISRRTGRTVLLVPTTASVAGVLSNVTQTGQGAPVTVSADSNGPFDDATAIFKCTKSGACGVAEGSWSWAYTFDGGQPMPLYQSAMVIPARAQAEVIGTVDLSTLTYAKPAIVTGTVDLTSLTYGPSGTVDTLTLKLNADGGGLTTTTFAAPDNADEIVEQINTAMGSEVASLSPTNRLVLTGATLGASGSMVVDASSTGETLLGLTGGTTNGTAGTLDGGTLIFDEDSTTAQTVTFGAPADAAAVLAAINAKTNVTASLYSAQNRLRIVSNTKGSGSALSITGGNKRSALGLPLVNAAGAESTYHVDHLGFTATFSNGANLDFVAGTTYAWTCKAPKPSDADINAQIDAIKQAGLGFVPIVIAQTTDLVSSVTRAASIDAKMTALHGQRQYKRALLGVDPADSDASVKAAFSSYRSAWVDPFARGAYMAVSERIPGGGYTLRSSAWLGAMVDAFLDYWKDRGDRSVTFAVGVIGLPEVGGITSDEKDATTPLVSPVGSGGISFNVLTKDPDGGIYFSGGYTAADGTSKYCDASTRNVVLRGAEIYDATLSRYENNTDLDTNDDGTLMQASADEVNTACERAVGDEMVPKAAQAVRSEVDTTVNFYQLKKLKGKFTIHNRVPARTVIGEIGPGLIAS